MTNRISRIFGWWWGLWFIPMLAGLIASLSLTPVYDGIAVLWILPFFALGWPLYVLGHVGSTRRAFIIGHGAGFGWFVYSLSWISQSMLASEGSHTPFVFLLVPFTIAGLPLAFGIFWGIAFAGAVRMAGNRLARILFAIGLLAIMEYARGFVFTGLPWNAPGMVFANPALGAASVFGLWGLTIIAFIAAAAPVFFVFGHRRWGVFAGIIFLMVPVAGFFNAAPDNFNKVTVFTARLVQPAIPQNDKWRDGNRDKHLTSLVRLSLQPGDVAPDVIVWPETAFEGFLERQPNALRQVTELATAENSMLITGLLRNPADGVFHNAMTLHDSDGVTKNIYDKQKLVPFGEYLPFRSLIPFGDIIAGPNDFTPGPERDMMVVATGNGRAVELLPLICYEVIFPGRVRSAVNGNAPDAIVTISNDAWFGDTQGPHQHLAAARMRAAELGIPVIRVANTGISAAIDAYGGIIAKTAYGEAGIRDVAIGPGRDTLYAFWGDAVFWLLVAGVIISGLAIQGLTEKKQSPE